VGTQAGIARWEDGGLVPFPAGHPLSELYAVALREDAGGRLWVGLASGGVLVWDGNEGTVLDQGAGLSDQVIWSLAPDADGGMWVGTNGDGAFHVAREGGIHRLGTADGLPSPFVWQTLVDAGGVAWFYTSRGLARLDASGVRSFGLADGLIDMEGTAGAALEDSAGRLWFGTSRGVLAYLPEEEVEGHPAPPARIETFTADGVVLDPGGDVPPGTSLLQARFAALSFRDERAIRFQWRLVRDGALPGDWSAPVEERTLNLTRPRPGRYTLQVRAVDRDGVVSDTPAEMPIVVRPGFWERAWVQLLLLGLLFAAVAAAPRIRARRLEAERGRLEAQVVERTAALEDANRSLEAENEERRRIESALWASEERLREIIENTTNVFYAHDANHEITYISPQVREVFGIEPEIFPEIWTQLATDHPVNEEGIRITEETLRTGKRHPPYELQLRHADGHPIWVLVTEAPVVKAGVVVGVVGSLTDVTDARAAEEARARLEEELREARKMEAVGRLAGGIAHDFNNLLTSVLGRTNLLLMDLPEGHPFRRDLEGIEDASRKAAGLVAQLLAVGRRQVVRPTALALNETLHATLRALEPRVPPGVSLEFELTGEELWVEMDPSQLDQVVEELVLNAIDALTDGGTLGLRTRAIPPGSADAAVGAEEMAGSAPGVRIECSDSGVGMPPEVLSRVFEPFFTTKNLGEASGLGLATVYGIVKQNHGDIRIESTPGRGTRVTIELPRIRPPLPASG
jgi:PAS domain S-box-containing protein